MMTVHFIASKSNIAEDVGALKMIMDVIETEGHKTTRDWVGRVHTERTQGDQKKPDWSEIYKTNIELIAKSDVVIAETSYNSFGVGYQVALAVQQRKPVLLLRSEKADTDAFATGVVDEWVELETYHKLNLRRKVREFLQRNDIGVKYMRFNFFIDRQIYNYLRWTALKTGKTKAEVLRGLVEQEIQKSNGDTIL